MTICHIFVRKNTHCCNSHTPSKLTFLVLRPLLKAGHRRRQRRGHLHAQDRTDHEPVSRCIQVVVPREFDIQARWPAHAIASSYVGYVSDPDLNSKAEKAFHQQSNLSRQQPCKSKKHDRDDAINHETTVQSSS